MVSTLEVYREFVTSPNREVSVGDLQARGLTRNHAHAMLTRLTQDGAAERIGAGRVRLFPLGESVPVLRKDDPIVRELKAKGAKATGFTVLPRRYPGPRPKEFLVRSGKTARIAEYLHSHHPELRVRVGSYEADEHVVCLYPTRVRGKTASVEEALVHIFRHAPRSDFALALQGAIQTSTKFNWPWFRRQPEWRELAGVFVALNDLAGRHVFPQFANTDPPSLSFDDLEVAAQPLIARGSRAGA
ncbi:MAG: hypothetical protein WDA16_13825 [Candidatus Thermoplasmatota archaeon]